MHTGDKKHTDMKELDQKYSGHAERKGTPDIHNLDGPEKLPEAFNAPRPLVSDPSNNPE